MISIKSNKIKSFYCEMKKKTEIIFFENFKYYLSNIIKYK